MVITGRSANFEQGLKEFKENLPLVAKLLGEKEEYSETSVMMVLLQRVLEERKHYKNGKDPRSCEIVVKPQMVEYNVGGVSFGWSVMADGQYEFYLYRDQRM